MCTEEEVRQVIKKASLPLWVQYALSALSLITVSSIGWLLLNAHETELKFLEYKKELTELSMHREQTFLALVLENNKLSSEREKASILAIALLTGKIELLSNNLENIKEVAINRSTDRYTGSQARSDKALTAEQFKNTHRRHDMSQLRQTKSDERQDRTDKRLTTLEQIVKDYHASGRSQ